VRSKLADMLLQSIEAALVFVGMPFGEEILIVARKRGDKK
jgi:hypothetical protein